MVCLWTRITVVLAYAKPSCGAVCFQVDGMGDEECIQDCLAYSECWKIHISMRDVDYRLRPKTIRDSNRWGASSELKLRQISKEYRECTDPNTVFLVDQAIDGSEYFYDVFLSVLNAGRCDYTRDETSSQWYQLWTALREFLRLESDHITPELRERIRAVRDKDSSTLSADTITEMIGVDRIRRVYTRDELLNKFS
jgi:hypothetical protein